MKFALLGYGYWGKKLQPLLGKYAEVLVVDPAYEKSVSLQVVLNDPSVTHVFIATPEETHFELTLQCLQFKKHTFVEKPLCLFEHQAKLLCQQATLSDVVLFVDYTFLYDQGFLNTIQLVESGKIGKLKRLSSKRCSTGFFKPHIDVTDDLAPHDIYIMKKITKLPILETDVLSSFEKEGRCVEATVQYTLKNSVFIATYSWAKERSERVLSVEGEKGTIIWERKEDFDQLLINNLNGEHYSQVVSKSIPALVLSIETFLAQKNNNLETLFTSYVEDIYILERIRKKLKK